MISPAKIYSILGNPKALAPLGVKDGANCLGLTASAYATGKKEEAQDRFIDEAGTEVIWLGGIPAFKKLIDKTVFKVAKLDANYDIRNLENKEIFQKTKEHAPTKEIAEGIDKIASKAKLFKALSLGKVVLATAMTFGAYDVLTDLRQKYIYKKVKKQVAKEMAQGNSMDKFIKKSMSGEDFVNTKNSHDYPAFSSLKTHNSNKNNPSFKGGLVNFVLDPVKNMYVLDGGITSQRLIKSRNSQDFAGYVIKEGGFLFFMYYLGQKIQDHMEHTASKNHGKSINLDSRILEDDHFKKMFIDGSIEKHLEAFPSGKDVKDVDLYEFLHNHPENTVVSVAKKAEIIQTYKEPVEGTGVFGFFKAKKNTGKIDTRKYINLGETEGKHAYESGIRGLHKHISKLYSEFKASGEDVDTFFNGVRKLKRSSIKKNMAASMVALGVILPGIMLAKRLLSGDKEYAVKKQVREDMEKEMQAKNGMNSPKAAAA